MSGCAWAGGPRSAPRCTDPAHRGQGLAARLVRSLARGHPSRDEQPFLHAVTTNTGAIALYESVGSIHRTHLRPVFQALRAAG
ncbi:GNAT family N-acetyltransferase [Saccharopolyspora aridisoli]|uniref:GNAT family N-acetyltransferase n=1 Tax=Saccharopolyspora aridisoli TaxID=2530385 RepID=UPI001F405405|nr:GNAT family N-acetyltransferase [Saccharopolyspora aridisoli]